MKKTILILALSLSIFGCSNIDVPPKTYCWSYTRTCDYLDNGNPTIYNETECGGTESDFNEFVFEIEKYGCKVSNVTKK